MIRKSHLVHLLVLCLILAAFLFALAALSSAAALRSRFASQAPARTYVSTPSAVDLQCAPNLSNRSVLDPSKRNRTYYPIRIESLPHPGSGLALRPAREPARIQHGDSSLISFPSMVSSLDQGADACPAYIIPSVPFADSGTTIGRMDDFAVSCNWGNRNPDVIYQFTPQASGFYRVLFTYHFPSMLFVVRAGGQCPGDSEIVCSMDTACVLGLESGTNYYFIIDCYYTSPGSGAYMFFFTGPRPCSPDFNLIAPGSVSGNTCMAGDHCAALQGEDQMVRVVVPHTGRWTFSLCDGQDWYATMYLMHECCGPPLGSADYGCQGAGSGRRPVIYGQDLVAGEYFVNIDGDECGLWTLEVTELNCATRPLNDSCSSVTVVHLPATFVGDNTCAANDCEFWDYGNNDVWHAFVLDSPADVVVDYCGTSDDITNVAGCLVQGCPCDDLIWHDFYNYQLCNGEYIIRFFYLGLAAGTYYLPVIGQDNYNDGPYTIHVYSAPSCSVARGPADLEECPETPDPDHSWNDCSGGCNVSTPAYQDISLTDTIYGRVFTYLGSNGRDYRDTDWYRLLITDTVAVTVTAIGESPLAVGIIELPNCDQLRIRGWTSTYTRCDTLLVTSECLLPGTYVLFIAPTLFRGLDDPVHYRAFLSTTECEPCRIVEQPGDIPEGEPDCYPEYDDHYNIGCNGWPEVYTDIAVSQTVFGNAGVYPHSWGQDTVLFRDTDWYRFTITEHAYVSWTVESDFPALIALCYYCDDEFDGAMAVADIPPCESVTLRSPRCLGPGTYVTYVATSDWGPYPCGSHYRGSLTREPCTTCDTSLALGNDVLENEPVCQPGFTDSTNGGCNSYPPVFGPPLACGQSIVGTSGTTWGNNGSLRDTDWIPITVPGTQSVVVNWCVFAQFPPMIAILRAGNCDSLMLVSEIVTGFACDTVCAMNAIPPGNYWLYISPVDFHTTTCNSQYRAWTTCAPCIPDTVRDVTIRRVGDAIVLRWNAQPNFIGTYSVYVVRDSAVTLLRANIAPVLSPGRTVVADTTDFEDVRYYYVTSTCP